MTYVGCLIHGHHWSQSGVGTGTVEVIWADFLTCDRCGATMELHDSQEGKATK